MSVRDVLESVIKRITVFKNKDALYPEFIPPILPHRETHIKQLAEIFKSLITYPGSASLRAMLVGGVGVGKTVTARVFGNEIKHLAKEQSIDLRYVHVNCHRDRTLYEVISEIIRQLAIPIPLRGLSPREMMIALLSYIEKHNIYTLITLDEFDYFIHTAGNDSVYFLVRLYDEYPDVKKRLNFIFIARDITALSTLDPTTESYILKHLIKFEQYKARELYDILIQRRDLAFYEGTVDDEVIRFIAGNEGVDKGGEGNARSAIEVLLLAGEAAEHEGSHKVSLEHVRKALSVTHPDIIKVSDELNFLQIHELLLIKALIRTLRARAAPFVRIGDVEEEYRYICQLHNIKPRKHTQIYEYVNNLKHMNIVNAKLSGKGLRGRTTLLSIVAPLDALEKRIDELINKKLNTNRDTL
ncbi:MAG: ORC1-type DNA replication protein [Ignisphaera sp.]|nr:ORC1-type DNA replication protein [Ignisphaera sp.]MDW8084986.1 ORC1-type DNA replication protein [Ignisphaera sp.]